MIAVTALTIFVLAMVTATFTDIIWAKIPNWLQLVVIGSFAVFAFAVGFSLEQVGWHLAGAGVLFAYGFFTFMMGVTGAGDAKLMTTAGLWFGISGAAPFLLYTILFGAVVMIVVLVAQRTLVFSPLARIGFINNWLLRKGWAPYGVGIGPAALFALSKSPLPALALATL